MNVGELSVRNNQVVFAAILLIVAGGAVAYRNLGRLEDPEFTIKEALIITLIQAQVPRKSHRRSPTRSKAPASNSVNSVVSNLNLHAAGP